MWMHICQSICDVCQIYRICFFSFGRYTFDKLKFSSMSITMDMSMTLFYYIFSILLWLIFGSSERCCCLRVLEHFHFSFVVVPSLVFFLFLQSHCLITDFFLAFWHSQMKIKLGWPQFYPIYIDTHSVTESTRIITRVRGKEGIK